MQLDIEIGALCVSLIHYINPYISLDTHDDVNHVHLITRSIVFFLSLSLSLSLSLCVYFHVCVDFCPFAQRAWLAISEKEKTPSSPSLYNYIEVNYFNPSLPLTQEFLKIHNTVPAGKWDGEVVKESMPIAYLIDERFAQNPLQPASNEGKQLMKSLITKYTTGKYDVVVPFYNFLFLQPGEDDAAIKVASKSLLETYAELSKDLQASGGPYLVGQQYTLADIALIPFVDRALLLLGASKSFVVPQTSEYESFHAWRTAYKARDGYKVTNADRLQRSLDVQPFASVKRDEYIIEMYQSYINNVRTEVRKQLRNAPAGKATQDIQAAKKEQRDEREKERKAVQVNQYVKIGVFAAVGVIVLAKLFKK